MRIVLALALGLLASICLAADPEGVELVAQTGTDGGFNVARAAGARTRIFASGPGCPLRSFSIRNDDPASREPLTLACTAMPANLQLVLVDAEGKPVPQRAVALRRGGEVFPADVVAAHLGRFGLTAFTDGSGRLALVGLEPGDYQIYLADASNPTTLAAGLPNGYVTAVSLPPLATAELEVKIDLP